MTQTNELADRIAIVQSNIARAAVQAGRSAAEVTLVAVSKTMPAENVVSVAELGVKHFGENRVQEAESKLPLIRQTLDPALVAACRWHLIGHLQSNKARLAARLFSVVESVDSLQLARTLDRIARDRGERLDVLLEVNVGEEASKFGFGANEIVTAFPDVLACTGLNIRGLMTVAPAVLDAEAVRPYFRQLRLLRDRLVAKNGGTELRELSMGMTGDYPVAIEEGATIVRVGRAIFGERS